MTAPFLALITPLVSGPVGPVDPGYSPPWARPRPPRPDQGLPGGQPPYPDNSLPGNQPYPDNSLPGNQPYPDNSLPGYQPYPDNSLPGSQPYPDNSLPGRPPGIWGPTDPRPTPPIYIPPQGGEPPLGIWGPTDPRPGYGLPGPQPHPEHPIVLPPDLPPTTPEGGKIDWKTAWTPQTGWVVVGIPAEGTLVPTPSS